jgi:hypothetical protein
MIKITHKNLDAIAREHFEGLKDKIDIDQDELEEIILAKPDKLEEVAHKYSDYADKFDGKYKAFSRKDAKYGAYNLAKKLQVNVCPYCNENPTYTIDEDTKITRPEFDHFYDKATFPVLSLSFYNLIPCCHICNSTLKGSTKFSTSTHIHPYSDSFDKKAEFKLKIKDSTFYHSVDGFKLKLKFYDKRAEKSAEVFKIQERYEQHKELILELIQKQEIYPESYIDELLTNYEGTLFKNKEDLLRVVTCGYISDEELGKRPLSKLIKDISKEVGLS